MVAVVNPQFTRRRPESLQVELWDVMVLLVPGLLAFDLGLLLSVLQSTLKRYVSNPGAVLTISF